MSQVLASGGLGNRIPVFVRALHSRHPDAPAGELVNYVVTAYCPVVNGLTGLSDGEKQARMVAFTTQVAVAAYSLSEGSITLYDPSTPFYASEAAPAEIDGMLDKLVTQLNFSPPLVDFLYHDPYRSVRGNVQYGFYLGLNDVNGRSCQMLAFVEKDIDWQIWIDTGPQLTPCKLVITYKTRPSQPQFSAVFTDWDFAPRIATPVFTPDLPAGTQRVPFETVSAAR